MKRIATITLLLLLVATQCFAWTKVVQLDAGHFSVNEDSIKHYVSKGNFDATSGVYNYYDYATRVETSFVVSIRDDDLSYIVNSSCTWVNNQKQSCDATPKFYRTYRGSNGETIMQWMVNYRRQTRADDGSI